jgi:secondary thiamine-phosphate synthase enzyme
MKQANCEIEIKTRGKGLYNITAQVQSWVEAQGCRNGLLTVFLRHTSASLMIQENADPDVLMDLNDFFSRIVPEDDRLYRHTTEGSDDMPAHIRTALTQTHLSIPVVAGGMALGTWQGLYLFEHRHGRQQRQVVLHLLGD